MSIVRGGAAERAGVRKGDHLIWMNGAAVSDLTHFALSRMVRTYFPMLRSLLCLVSERHYQ